MPAAWVFWALLSAAFAALTAIFAKVGVEGVPSDFATFLRTLVVVAVLAAILTAFGEWRPLSSISSRTYVFLTLSGLATGASWLCYFRALKLGDAARRADRQAQRRPGGGLRRRFSSASASPAANWAGVALIAAGAVLVAWRG